jgi:hypothetical protein
MRNGATGYDEAQQFDAVMRKILTVSLSGGTESPKTL